MIRNITNEYFLLKDSMVRFAYSWQFLKKYSLPGDNKSVKVVRDIKIYLKLIHMHIQTEWKCVCMWLVEFHEEPFFNVNVLFQELQKDYLQ